MKISLRSNLYTNAWGQRVFFHSATFDFFDCLQYPRQLPADFWALSEGLQALLNCFVHFRQIIKCVSVCLCVCVCVHDRPSSQPKEPGE